MSISQSIARHFTRQAGNYERLGGIQSEAADQLSGLLPENVPVPLKILEAGCGTGLFTRRLLHRYPGASLEALDLSEGMIHHARRAFPDESRVTWIVADAGLYRTSVKFGLIASNCALQWLYPFEPGMRNLLSLLAPDGVLVASLMVHGTLRELRETRLMVAPHKPFQANLPTFTEIRALLDERGFRIETAMEKVYVRHTASGWDAIRQVHEQGLTGGPLSRSTAPLTRGEMGRLADACERCFGEDRGVPMTYRVGFFVGKNIEPGLEKGRGP